MTQQALDLPIDIAWQRLAFSQTFRLLQDSVGGVTPNTLNTRIKEMREAGLINHNDNGYIVTSSGADLLRRLGDLPSFATKWVNNQAKKK